MAHAHDRTLLASLGFADPDKKNPRHTLACQYLARPDVAEKVWRRLRPAAFVDPGARYEKGLVARARTELPRFESPIVKGSAQYSTVIGFIDVVLALSWEESSFPRIVVGDRFQHKHFYDKVTHTWVVVELDSLGHPRMRRVDPEPGKNNWDIDCPFATIETSGRPLEWKRVRPVRAAVEVKVTPIDVADIARQVALYRQYAEEELAWCVALTWPLHAEDRAVLESKNIDVLTLGPAFDRYCEERKSAPPVVDEAL